MLTGALHVSLSPRRCRSRRGNSQPAAISGAGYKKVDLDAPLATASPSIDLANYGYLAVPVASMSRGPIETVGA
jgi:hypothetical protein